MQLTTYYQQIGAQGVRLYAVSVDPPETSETLRQRLHCDFTFLSDRDRKVLDLLNIRHRGAHPASHDDIAYPTQVLVDKDGIVRWTFQSDNYRVRARPEQVFAAIAQLPH